MQPCALSSWRSRHPWSYKIFIKVKRWAFGWTRQNVIYSFSSDGLLKRGLDCLIEAIAAKFVGVLRILHASQLDSCP